MTSQLHSRVHPARPPVGICTITGSQRGLGPSALGPCPVVGRHPAYSIDPRSRSNRIAESRGTRAAALQRRVPHASTGLQGLRSTVRLAPPKALRPMLTSQRSHSVGVVNPDGVWGPDSPGSLLPSTHQVPRPLFAFCRNEPPPICRAPVAARESRDFPAACRDARQPMG